MNEEIMNVENEDVVHPQSGENEEIAAPQSGEGREDVAAPQGADIDAMTDDEFEEHLRKLAQGETVRGAAERPSEAESKPENEGTAKPAEEQGKPFKQFMTQQEYQGEIDRIVSKRFGELQRKNRESLDLLGQITIQARNFYGDAGDDTAAVNALIRDLTSQNANNRGIEEQEYNRQTQDAADARRYREIEQQRRHEQEKVDEIKRQWQNDSEKLRGIVSDFDFMKAMENKRFNDAILSGKSVFEAYMIANRQPAQKPQANNTKPGKPIMQVAQGRGNAPGEVHPDIDKMTDEEFDAYMRRHRGD